MTWWLESINRKNKAGVMIAFLVPKGTANGLTLQQDALPTGSEALPPEDLHLTLAFLGEASEMLIARSEVLASLALFAAQQPPLTGRLNGLGAFTAQGGKCPLYMNFDCAELPEFRQDLIAALAAVGVDINSQHGFTPHVTLAYVPEGVEASGLTVPDKEVTFDRVGLFWGGQVEFCPLKGDVTMSTRANEGARKLTDVTSHQVAEAVIGEDRTPDGGYLLSGVVIAEGISANGNLYTIKALKSGAGAFAGRPIYADHPSRSEESDRPERSVRDLVGRLSENEGDFWIERNRSGTNVLRFKNARLSTTAGWLATMIKEGIAGDMSINAMGSGEDRDGMFNVTEFTEATSLDFVTVAAAGGLGTVAEGDRSLKPTETDLPALTLVRLAAARPDLVNAIAARERQKAYGERDEFRQMRRRAESQDRRMLKLEAARQEAEAEAMMERALASSGLPVPIQKAVRGVCQKIVAEHLSRPAVEQMLPGWTGGAGGMPYARFDTGRDVWLRVDVGGGDWTALISSEYKGQPLWQQSGFDTGRAAMQAAEDQLPLLASGRPVGEAEGEFKPEDRVKVISGQYAGDEGKIVEEHGKWWLVAIDEVGDRKLKGSEIELAEAQRAREVLNWTQRPGGTWEASHGTHPYKTWNFKVYPLDGVWEVDYSHSSRPDRVTTSGHRFTSPEGAKLWADGMVTTIAARRAREQLGAILLDAFVKTVEWEPGEEQRFRQYVTDRDGPTSPAKTEGQWWDMVAQFWGLDPAELRAQLSRRRAREAKTMPVTFWINSADLDEDEAGKFKKWLEKEKGDAADDQKSKADWKALYTEFGKAGEEAEEAFRARHAREAKTMPVTFWINSADLDEDEAGKFKKWLKKEKGDAADDQKSKADWKALYTEFGKAGEEEAEEAEEAFRAYKVRVRQEIEALAAAAPLADWAELADAAADYLGVYNADGFTPGWMRGIARGVLEADAPASDEVKGDAKDALLKHKEESPDAPALLAAEDVADLLDLFDADGNTPDWLQKMAEDIFEARRQGMRRGHEAGYMDTGLSPEDVHEIQTRVPDRAKVVEPAEPIVSMKKASRRSARRPAREAQPVSESPRQRQTTRSAYEGPAFPLREFVLQNWGTWVGGEQRAFEKWVIGQGEGNELYTRDEWNEALADWEGEQWARSVASRRKAREQHGQPVSVRAFADTMVMNKDEEADWFRWVYNQKGSHLEQEIAVDILDQWYGEFLHSLGIDTMASRRRAREQKRDELVSVGIFADTTGMPMDEKSAWLHWVYQKKGYAEVDRAELGTLDEWYSDFLATVGGGFEARHRAGEQAMGLGQFLMEAGILREQWENDPWIVEDKAAYEQAAQRLERQGYTRRTGKGRHPFYFEKWGQPAVVLTRKLGTHDWQPREMERMAGAGHRAREADLELEPGMEVQLQDGSWVTIAPRGVVDSIVYILEPPGSVHITKIAFPRHPEGFQASRKAREAEMSYQDFTANRPLLGHGFQLWLKRQVAIAPDTAMLELSDWEALASEYSREVRARGDTGPKAWSPQASHREAQGFRNWLASKDVNPVTTQAPPSFWHGMWQQYCALTGRSRETTPPPDVVAAALRDAGFSAEESGADVIVSLDRPVTAGEVWSLLMDHGVDRGAIKQQGDQVIVTTSYEARRPVREIEKPMGNIKVDEYIRLVGMPPEAAEAFEHFLVYDSRSGSANTLTRMSFDAWEKFDLDWADVWGGYTYEARRLVREMMVAPREVQPGDLVDFGAYGNLYVLRKPSVGSWWVTDREEDRFNPNASGMYTTAPVGMVKVIERPAASDLSTSPLQTKTARRPVREQTDFARVPPQMLEGLCDAIGPDPDFHTRCMDKGFGDLEEQITDKAAFCAELHKQCVGKWPAEEARRRARAGDVSLDALAISSGTLATLTGYRDYVSIDQVQGQFYEFVVQNPGFTNWVRAWEAFAQQRGHEWPNPMPVTAAIRAAERRRTREVLPIEYKGHIIQPFFNMAYEHLGGWFAHIDGMNVYMPWQPNERAAIEEAQRMIDSGAFQASRRTREILPVEQRTEYNWSVIERWMRGYVAMVGYDPMALARVAAGRYGYGVDAYVELAKRVVDEEKAALAAYVERTERERAKRIADEEKAAMGMASRRTREQSTATREGLLKLGDTMTIEQYASQNLQPSEMAGLMHWLETKGFNASHVTTGFVWADLVDNWVKQSGRELHVSRRRPARVSRRQARKQATVPAPPGTIAPVSPELEPGDPAVIELPPDAASLPEEAQMLWLETYITYLDSGEEPAMHRAWAAVYDDGWEKDESGRWIKGQTTELIIDDTAGGVLDIVTLPEETTAEEARRPVREQQPTMTPTAWGHDVKLNKDEMREWLAFVDTGPDDPVDMSTLELWWNDYLQSIGISPYAAARRPVTEQEGEEEPPGEEGGEEEPPGISLADFVDQQKIDEEQASAFRTWLDENDKAPGEAKPAEDWGKAYADFQEKGGGEVEEEPTNEEESLHGREAGREHRRSGMFQGLGLELNLGEFLSDRPDAGAFAGKFEEWLVRESGIYQRGEVFSLEEWQEMLAAYERQAGQSLESGHRTREQEEDWAAGADENEITAEEYAQHNIASGDKGAWFFFIKRKGIKPEERNRMDFWAGLEQEWIGVEARRVGPSQSLEDKLQQVIAAARTEWGGQIDQDLVRGVGSGPGLPGDFSDEDLKEAFRGLLPDDALDFVVEGR